MRGDDLVDCGAAFARPPRRVVQISANGKMAEQARVWNTQPTGRRWGGTSMRRELSSHGSPRSAMWPRAFSNPCNQPQQRGLAAAAWPEHGRDAVEGQGGSCFDVERAQCCPDVQFEGFRWHGRGTDD